MLAKLRDRLRGWKTLIANVLFAVVPVMELTEFRNVVPESLLPWYALFVVLANMYLRSITKTPVGRSKPPQGQEGCRK